MDTEQFYSSANGEPVFFRAPSNFDETCKYCGLPLNPGVIVAEITEDEFACEPCIWCKYEDMTEEKREREQR